MKKKLLLWSKHITVTLVILVLAFASTGAIYQVQASAADQQQYPPPGRLVDVGGYRLHLHCVGEGSPTIVLEAGMSGWSTDWILVQPEIGKITRVCAYDRAGYGWSESGPQPRDSRQVASELHTLLKEAGIDGNIILVGHSLGGLFAQYYARTYPEQIAGIILVDSVHYEQSLRMEEGVRQKYEGGLRALTLTSRLLAPIGLMRLADQAETILADKLPAEYREMVRALGLQTKAYLSLDAEMASFEQSQIQVQESDPLPTIPLAVISSTTLNGFPPGFSGEYMREFWSELQADLAQSATLPQVIAEDSGHYIHIDQPELVIQTVAQMLETAR